MKISQVISDLKYKKVNIFRFWNIFTWSYNYIYTCSCLYINTYKCYIYYTYKMNIKTNLLEEYVNFVDNTKQQNKYFKIFLFLIVIIVFLFLCFVLFKYK